MMIEKLQNAYIAPKARLIELLPNAALLQDSRISRTERLDEEEFEF